MIVCIPASWPTVRACSPNFEKPVQITELSSSKLLAAAGENSDRVAFTEYIKSNLALHQYRTGLDLSTAGTAAWIRSTVIWPYPCRCAPVRALHYILCISWECSVQLATYLRKRPYQVNLLLGGYDADDGASLYYIDYMGTKQKTNFGAHGYCSNFILSVMDRHWKVRL
jgi:20S proteasome subunit beta 4